MYTTSSNNACHPLWAFIYTYIHTKKGNISWLAPLWPKAEKSNHLFTLGLYRGLGMFTRLYAPFHLVLTSREEQINIDNNNTKARKLFCYVNTSVL